MASRSLRFIPVFLLLSFSTIVFSEFPNKKDVIFAFYQTEVQITDVLQETSAYATEYYSDADQQGALKLYFQGDQQLVYYDNSSIVEVNGNNCTAWAVDESEFDYKPIYYGWLNKKPIIIGPSAALWYGFANAGKAVKVTDKKKNDVVETVRSIQCKKYILQVVNENDNLTFQYYFATSDWTTPYSYKNLLVPVRIRINGTSSRYAASGQKTKVDQINDFAYFKPSIDDMNNLMPPLGLGCKLMKKTDYLPDISNSFQYSAEVFDVLAAKEHEDVEIQFQRTWYDQDRKLARRDTYSRKNGYRSNLYDFNTGATYKMYDDGSCQIAILRDSDFQIYDFGMTSRMKTPKEVLNLDGKFYEMGRRTIRGLECDVFESVQEDKHFKNKKYDKLVVTAYFTNSETKIGVFGEDESRIPVYYIVTGYNGDKKTLHLQYNIFSFDDVVWPQMYSSFRLDRCYTKPDQKVYFVMIIPVRKAEDAAMMEKNDEFIMTQLRSSIAVNARIPEMRIPYLKADYKPTGVYVTGVMLERPPAIVAFFDIDTGDTETKDPDLKPIVKAETTEQCAYACVDEADFPCKGFYFCGQACFLKSTDPFEDESTAKSENLGVCTEYIRDEIDSTNFRQSYLVDAFGYLNESVFAGNVTFAFKLSEDSEEIVTVLDIVIGDGPYDGGDSGDKPYAISYELRKLDESQETVKTMDYAGSLHDCYKMCKEAGSECSTFSFCPDSKNDNKECMISSDLVIKGVTKDEDLIPDKNCNVYNLKYSDYFIEFPERVSLLPGDKVIRSVDSLQKCAASCRTEDGFTCRGFEYCSSKKICTLHKKHILDLKPGESGSSKGRECVHYAARYIIDYMDMGGVLIEDDSNVRYGTSLEECAKICSEDFAADCKSFNYCDRDDFKGTDTSCSLSSKLLRDDGIATTEKSGCMHYEKRDSVHDWDNSKAAKGKLTSGYTKKGFAGLVVGMIALGIIVGALGFIFYAYMKSRNSGEGMAVRFMKNDS